MHTGVIAGTDPRQDGRRSRPHQAKSGSDLLAGELIASFDPAARRLALAARPAQKPFACRDQFTAIHQFDEGVYLRRDTERVRISVSTQHLPVIQPQRSTIKQCAEDPVAFLIALLQQARAAFRSSSLSARSTWLALFCAVACSVARAHKETPNSKRIIGAVSTGEPTEDRTREVATNGA